jgi:transglutaminase superfamily protein
MGMNRFLLLLQAFLGLIVYDCVLLVGRFRLVHRIVARWRVSPAHEKAECTDDITQAINLACVWYPWEVLCLQRSAVSVCLLRSHGIKAEMVTGAQQIPFAAHAWVEVAGRAVNERLNVHQRFTVWERC